MMLLIETVSIRYVNNISKLWVLYFGRHREVSEPESILRNPARRLGPTSSSPVTPSPSSPPLAPHDQQFSISGWPAFG